MFMTGALLLLAFMSHVVDATEKPVVKILKMKFIPQEITIKRGENVHWINREKRQYHSVWFEKYGDPEPDYLSPMRPIRATLIVWVVLNIAAALILK